MTGRRLAHYEIKEKIGSGGMGEVYRARDTKLDRDVALKILPQNLAADPERAARFELEARAVAALKHPNIVTIYAVEEVDGVRFMAMELVEGKTLTQVIPPGGLPLGRFLDVAIPLADAVAAAHAKGITHRDLKPDNVMVEPDGRIKVLDFGLAKLLEVGLVSDLTVSIGPRSTQEGRILGTVAYMSPEQAEGKPVDPRSDVFSLGIVLYEMITGDRPFQGDTHISTITAILRDAPKPVHERTHAAPRQLDRILQRCLEKAPDRRYETARGLRNDLDSLRVEETSQPNAAAIPPVRSATKRFPMWAALGAVVLIGLGGTWYATRDRNTATATQAPAAAAKPSMIVVFPFENMGSADDQYFAAGISEEITSRLSALKGLGVVSRTSANQYDRKGKTMPMIAADLGVDYVLDGTVRWAKGSGGASQVRITPQLIKAEEDRQVWSASYDRSMDEIFRIQSEIAGEVVDKLGMAVGGREREALSASPTDNVEAYHAFLKARELTESIRFSEEDEERGIALLEEACAKDPRFLRAWGELAKTHAAFIHFAWDPSDERLARAKQAIDRAIAIDGDSPWTQLNLGYYHYWGRKDYTSADAALSKAQAGLPSSAEVAQAIAVVRRRQGRFEEAATQMERSFALDPQNALFAYTLGETQTILRRYDAAARSFDRCIALSANPTTAYMNRGRIALLAGDLPDARSWLARSMETRSNSSELRGLLLSLAVGCRDYDAALEVADDFPEAQVGQFGFDCRAAVRGSVLHLKGAESAARPELERALVAFDAYARGHADESNIHSLRGRVLALLGRKDEALREARLALTLRPASTDLWVRQYRLFDLALVEIIVGEHDAAVAHLGELLAQPSDQVSIEYLRLSPLFDALREHAGFKRLIAR